MCVQVLDMSAMPDEGSSEEDEELSYEQIYQHYQQQSMQSEDACCSDPAPSPSPSLHTTMTTHKSSNLGASSSSSQQQQQQRPLPAAKPPLPTSGRSADAGGPGSREALQASSSSSSDPFEVWRSTVEGTLAELSAAASSLSSSSARDAVLSRHCSSISAYMDHARKQTQASR